MTNQVWGWAGSFFYGICFFPQIYSIYKNKSPELNVNYVYLQFLGSSCMFLYGLTNNLIPIAVLNGFAWICIVLIMGGHFRNQKNNQILN